MDLNRIKISEADVAVLAVGISQTPQGNTHTGVVYVDGKGQMRFLEQAFHKVTRSELVQESVSFCDGLFLFALLDIDPDRAEIVAGLCRLIASTRPSFTYALMYDPDAQFDVHTGRLSLPSGKGLNCSTFVLVLFKSAQFPLIDFSGWPEREEDVRAHKELIRLLRDNQPPSEQGHIAAVENEVGCIRARPEEVAGSCLCRLPARFGNAKSAGQAILEKLGEIQRAG